MNDVLLLYLFTRLDAISDTFSVLAALCFFLAIVLAAIAASCYLQDPDDFDSELFKKKARRDNAVAPYWRRKALIAAAVAFVFGLLNTFTPRSNDIAIIVGGKIALDAARSDKGQEMAGAVYDAILAKLKEAAKGK